MNIIKQSVEIIDEINSKEILQKIEKIGRVCWKSEGKITDDSYIKFINMLINKKHESVLEHITMTIKIVTDRGTTHQIVRHRLNSYTQESTRFNKYTDIEIILPVEFYEIDKNNKYLVFG